MQHLLLGVSPSHLAQSPYVPVYTGAQRLQADEIGLRCDPGTHVWLLPNIAGWVGADTVGVLLSTGIYDDKEPALAIDIGTNGEMAMGSRERLITCSTAAGPAFEGHTSPVGCVPLRAPWIRSRSMAMFGGMPYRMAHRAAFADRGWWMPSPSS